MFLGSFFHRNSSKEMEVESCIAAGKRINDALYVLTRQWNEWNQHYYKEASSLPYKLSVENSRKKYIFL